MYDVFNMSCLRCTELCLLTFFAIMESCQVLTPVNSRSCREWQRRSAKRRSFGGSRSCCWRKKSHTPRDVRNLIINNGPMGITYLSTGAGFLPSTVDYRILRLDFIDELLHLPQISCRTWPSSKGNSRKQYPCFTSKVEGRF